jgi:uncharacterized iron-regulated membrane protein
VSETESPDVRKSWPDYRAVWRWHFYAGLVCIPFLIILSISGAIYLFKPQVEAWIERSYDNLPVQASSLKPASAQISAVLKAFPGSSFQSYEIPEHSTDAGRVIVNQNGEATRVYVHPESLAVLGSVAERDRFMKVLFRIHGELLMGNRGSMVVELAASWAILMILSGLFLWWPRKARGVGGILYPRLASGSRIFWRDLHSVTGFWISGLALFLLLSGLPWAKFWGDYLKNARTMTRTAVVRQDWTNGAEPKPPAVAEDHSGHGGGSSRKGGNRRNGPVDLAAFDRVVATVGPISLLPPVVIAPPAQGSTDWSAKSMTPNRPQRVDLMVDGLTGAIKDRKDFSDKHLIDRVVGTGIAAHEGQLFGWPNQMLGLMTAMGLVLLSLSSVVMWWRRREPGELGAPKLSASPRFSLGLLLIVVFLGVYLPLFGISLVVVLILEKLLLKRIPPVQRWLGLQPPRSRTSADPVMA